MMIQLQVRQTGVLVGGVPLAIQVKADSVMVLAEMIRGINPVDLYHDLWAVVGRIDISKRL